VFRHARLSPIFLSSPFCSVGEIATNGHGSTQMNVRRASLLVRVHPWLLLLAFQNDASVVDQGTVWPGDADIRGGRLKPTNPAGEIRRGFCLRRWGSMIGAMASKLRRAVRIGGFSMLG